MPAPQALRPVTHVTPAAQRARGSLIRRIALTALATLAVLELGARVMTGRLLAWGPEEERGSHWRFDPRLGYVLQDGLGGRVRNEFTVHTGAHGTRENGLPPPPQPHPVTLVVGDSFAFGDEVDDAATWPAVLQQAQGAPVINGAVPGFGLDQAVLRAEELAAIYDPDRILVSFIPHDVLRCELAIWSGNAKPYFEVEGSTLVLHPPRASGLQLALATPISRSVLMDSLFRDLLQRDGPDTRIHRRGPDVACLLMDRLVELERATGARVIVIGQPQSATGDPGRYRSLGGPVRTDAELVAGALACARERGLETLDLLPVFAERPLDERTRLFHGHGHNSPEGNRLIADAVHAMLTAP